MDDQLHRFAEEIRDLISDNETEIAIDRLRSFLEKDKKYRNLLDWVGNIRAEFQRASQKARRNLLNDEDFEVAQNQVNNQLFNLLRNLEEGKLEPIPQKFDGNQSSGSRSWITAILVVLLVGGGAYVGWRYFSNQNQSPVCPEFSSGSNLNVMLFPFNNVDGGNNKPHISIHSRLSQLCRENRINSSIELMPGVQEPIFEDDVLDAADRCAAELVIFGEVSSDITSTDIVSKYFYLGELEGLEVKKIQVEGETFVDTTTSISSIVRTGELTKDIEELILTLFGIIAHEEERYDLVVEQLEQLDPADTSGTILTGVLLADAYLALGKQAEALQSYDQVLQVHPEYSLALNNRAALEFMAGNYQKAADDYTRIIQFDPDNVDALAGRLAANTKLNRDDLIIQDEQKLRRINPDRLQRIRNFRSH